MGPRVGEGTGHHLGSSTARRRTDHIVTRRAELAHAPDQIARLATARIAYEELAEAYEGLRRMVERGYLTLR